MIDNCTFNDTGGVFTDMDTFIYQSNATITGKTYRRCGLVTQGGATFNKCVFENSTSTVSAAVSDLNLFTACIFTSDGSNHAVNLGTISSNTTVAWNNTSSGYASTNGSTGNETILVNVNNGVTLTINNNAGDTLSVYNTGTGTVNIVTGQRTKTFNISPTPSDYEYRIYTVTALGSLADSVEVQGAESTTSATQAYTYSYSAGINIAIQVLDHTNFYKERIEYFTLEDADTTNNINLEEDTND